MESASHPDLVVVTGMPRSGTSMMMRALGAGGLRLFCDHVRPPDQFNPYGYFELERVKRLREDPRILDRLSGGAVKVIYALATHLNPTRRYHFVVMQRDPTSVLASQNRMLQGLGKTSSPMDVDRLKKEMSDFSTWLTQARWITASYAIFEHWRSRPFLAAKSLAGTLSYPLDVEAMAASVQTTTPKPRNGNSTDRCDLDAINGPT